jgi:hypothetical protein
MNRRAISSVHLRIDHAMRTGVTGSPACAGDDSLWLPQAHRVIGQRTNGES